MADKIEVNSSFYMKIDNGTLLDSSFSYSLCLCVTLKYMVKLPLAGVAQWIEHGPVNQRVTGSILNLRHVPGLQARSPTGACKRQPQVDVSIPHFLPPFPSLKINK